MPFTNQISIDKVLRRDTDLQDRDKKSLPKIAPGKPQELIVFDQGGKELVQIAVALKTH